jgi:acetylcholinesterase
MIFQNGADNVVIHYIHFHQIIQNEENKSLFPVMVWLHGGGFFAGSGNAEMYGPEFLLDHDVIVVTINYRLGTLGSEFICAQAKEKIIAICNLGFLNLGTQEVSGNFGLKDQVAALKWVKNNIQSFGGDPNNVTLFGESGGGTSIHYLLISPLAKGK